MRPLILVALAIAALGGGAAAQQPRNLSGRWVLREKDRPRPGPDSAAAADSLRADSLQATALRADSLRADSARTDSMPPGSLPGAFGDRPPGAGAGPGPPRRSGPTPQERQQVARLLGMAQAVPAFTLDQSDTAIVVTNEDGFSYALHPDGRRRDLIVGQDTIAVRARWKDGVLVAEYEPHGGGKLTERYVLADSGLFLRLEVTVEHKVLMRPVWRPRMYRRIIGGG